MNFSLPLEPVRLLDGVLGTTALLAFASAAAWMLRRGPAAARHLLWTLALAGAIVLPAASLVAPKGQLPLLPVGVTGSVATVAVPPDRTAAPPHTAPALPVRAVRESDESDVALISPPALSSLPSLPGGRAVVALWAIGMILLLARVMAGVLAVAWLSRRTPPVTDAPWLPLAHALAGEMGLRRGVRYLRSGRATMPVAAGLLRSSVIVPEDADSWPEERLRVVLLHELAHVRRRDCLTHVVAQIACALHWFNPLVWMAARRARTERERACDDLVLAAGTRSTDYAGQLLEIARSLRGHHFGRSLAAASLGMAHESQLEGRLVAILDPARPRAGVSARVTFAGVALSLCLIAPLAAVQPWSTRSQ